MPQFGATIYRDYVTDGVALSGKWKPRKSDIREWTTWIESSIYAAVAGGGLIYETKSALDGDLDHDADQMAWVIGDTTVANNGIYHKVGASGTGSWERLADLPYSFIRGTNGGSGTADAIAISTLIPIPEGDGAALITVPIVADNQDEATVSFNGSTDLDIVTAAGNAVAAGDLKAGTIVHGYVVGTTFQLLTHFGVQHLLATVTGGTADAIEAETVTSIPAANGGASITMEIVETTTASPVTISFNGASALTVKTASGNDLPIGGFTAGMVIDGYVEDGNFRLRTDYASASIITQAETNVGYAEEWANKAEDSLVSAAAGGNESSEYSARHWAAKAEAGAAVALNNWVVDTFSGTGSEEEYTLSIAPGIKANLFVAIDGVLQAPETYSVTGTTLTLTAPADTDNISVRLGSSVEVEIGVPDANSVGTDELQDDAVTAAKIDDGAATKAKIGAEAIDETKIDPAATSAILSLLGTNVRSFSEAAAAGSFNTTNTSSFADDMSDAKTVVPTSPTSSLAFVAVTRASCSKDATAIDDIGGKIIVKYYDGTSHFSVGTSGRILDNNRGTNGAATIAATLVMAGVLTAAQRRVVEGDWLLRLWGNVDYAGNTLTAEGTQFFFVEFEP